MLFRFILAISFLAIALTISQGANTQNFDNSADSDPLEEINRQNDYLKILKEYNDKFCGYERICDGTPVPGIPAPRTKKTKDIYLPIKQVTIPEKDVTFCSGVNACCNCDDADPLNEIKSPFSEKYKSKDRSHFPSVVALINDQNTALCTGVIIDNNFVLSAAHCLCDRDINAMWIGNSVFPDLQIGFNKRFELDKSSTVLFSKGKRNISCDDRDSEKQNIDLGLIKILEKEEITNDYFWETYAESHVPLNSLERIPSRVVGFGVGGVENVTGIKRYGDIYVQLCDEVLAENEGCIAEKEYISINSAQESVDTCFGDSGGPIYAVDKKYLVLIGITSRKRAKGDAKYCGSGGIYVALTDEVNEWIFQNVLHY